MAVALRRAAHGGGLAPGGVRGRDVGIVTESPGNAGDWLLEWRSAQFAVRNIAG